jgi:hypothetical protein
MKYFINYLKTSLSNRLQNTFINRRKYQKKLMIQLKNTAKFLVFKIQLLEIN